MAGEPDLPTWLGEPGLLGLTDEPDRPSWLGDPDLPGLTTSLTCRPGSAILTCRN